MIDFYGGITIPEIKEDLLYTKTHEWLKAQDEIITLGVTDYAQEQLTDIVYVEDLPEVGEEISEGDPICVLNSVKSAEEVYAPVSGTVTEVNTRLEDEPELINTSPYEDGWLIKLKVENFKPKKFMTAEKYREFIESQ